MRREDVMHSLFIILALIIFSPMGSAEASVDLGVSIGEEGLRGFYLAVGNYYRGPEIFYVPVRETVVIGPPYGKAYGYYKKKPKKQWRTIDLSDADVVNLVNLRFVSDHYKYGPEKVMKLREGGKNFVAINDEVVKEKKGGKEKGEGRKNDIGKEKNKEKGKGNTGKGKK